MAIYCFECSNFDHANMHGDKKSKGYSILVDKYKNGKGHYVYDFKCRVCGYVNYANNKEYIKDYAIHQ